MRLFLVFYDELARPNFLYKVLNNRFNRYSIGGSSMHTISDKKLLMVRPEDLKYSSNRLRKNIDDYELRLLAKSISVNGIIEPLSIRRDEYGRLQLISGERRLKAAIMAGLRRVPCILHKIDESTVALYSLTENIHRCDLNAFEIAQGLHSLTTVFGMSQLQAASRIGIGQSALLNKLRLLRLDEGLRQRIIEGKISEQIAHFVLNLPIEQREAVVEKIISCGMNDFQAQQYINEKLYPTETVVVPPTVDKPVRKVAIGDVRLFSNSLTKLVETLQGAGVDANLRKFESDRYIEYRVKIKKEPQKIIEATQLRLC